MEIPSGRLLPQPDPGAPLAQDLFGEQGHPIRTTVSEMGPLLLARLLGLNETQEGVLNIAFRYADDQGLLLLDLKDLRAMLQHVGDNAARGSRPSPLPFHARHQPGKALLVAHGLPQSGLLLSLHGRPARKAWKRLIRAPTNPVAMRSRACSTKARASASLALIWRRVTPL